jgi:hypothetical protein
LRDEYVAQGDIFDQVEYLVPLAEGLVVEVGKIIVISHSCDCEKSLLRSPERPILIAPLVRLNHLPGGQPGDARAGRMARYWPLGHPTRAEAEYAVDLLLVQPMLINHVQEGSRERSMTDHGQAALGASVAKAVTYRDFKPEEKT